MSRYYRLLCLLAAGACFVPAARAAKVKVWHRHSPGHYDHARFDRTVVSSEGTLRLSRRLRPLAGLDASHVWDLAEDHDGNLFVATGGEGKIYKITPDGTCSVVYTCAQSQVLCLAVAADNTVYAGTGPNGQVIRLDAKGKGRVLCETGESYVWSLALDADSGSLYAGTGPHGRVLRITPAGKASVHFKARQEHILCLALAKGTLYAGTDKGGLVYRIERGKGFVLYQAPQAEVHALEATADGLYVGTSAPTKRHGISRGSSSEEGASSALDSAARGNTRGGLVGAAVAAAEERKSKKKRPVEEEEAEEEEESRDHSSRARSAPSRGENSVYRITADGSVREVFREKAMVLSLLRQGKRFLVGTGMDGQLFEIDERTHERSEIARLDHGQILALCRRKDGSIVIGTGDPGKLYVLQDRFAARGAVVSEVFDAKLLSKWGALRWEADTPESTAVSVAVRSGNVAEPDDTWSDWSEEQTDGAHATITAPTARFLQYRVTLTTRDPAQTPALRSITLRYATTNQAPEVEKVEVPDLNAASQDNPRKIKLKWSATDANEDELSYRLYVRKDGWKDWVELEDDLDRTDFTWDTTTTPSGIYRLKVVASDRKDNADGDALTGVRVSAPFVVCHTPPEVTVKTTPLADGRVRVEATARSPLVRLTAASYALNGKKWVNIFPRDGLCDSKEESFCFRTDALKPGTHVLVVRVVDAAGNTGSSDVVFTVPGAAER